MVCEMVGCNVFFWGVCVCVFACVCVIEGIRLCGVWLFGCVRGGGLCVCIYTLCGAGDAWTDHPVCIRMGVLSSWMLLWVPLCPVSFDGECVCGHFCV